MSLEDYESDLTELSSDEETPPVPLKSSSKPKKSPRKVTKEKEYEIVSVLKAPRQTNYSTKHLFDMMEADAVDLNPPYQRDVVWNEDKQVALIGSIFLNVAIPPIMLSTEQTRRGGEQRTCMDGKQRLTSIRRFLKGEIYFRHPDLGKRLWYNRPPRSTRTVLSAQQRQLFDLKQIACIEYDSLTEEQQRDIFQRVQNGVALTPAERLRATSGPRADLVREVLGQVPGSKRLFQSFEWGKGGDFHSLAFSIYLCHIYPAIKVINIPQLEKWLQEPQPQPTNLAAFQANVVEAFQIVSVLAMHTDFKGCLDKISQIPFTFVALLVYLHKKRMSLSQLASAVAGLRAIAGHTEMRTANTKTIKALTQYIKDLYHQKKKTDGDVHAVSEMIAYAGASSRESSVVPKTVKRKREDVDSDDDDKPIVKSRSSATGRTRSKSEHPTASATILPPATKKPTVRTVSNPASAAIKTERTSTVRKTPISSMPKFAKKSAAAETKVVTPTTTKKVLAESPATTKVKRKPTQAVVPNLVIEDATSATRLKYDIPTSLPEIEYRPVASTSRSPPASTHPSTSAPVSRIPPVKAPISVSAPVSHQQESASPTLPNSPLTTRRGEDRLKKLHDAKANFRTAPPYPISVAQSNLNPTPTLISPSEHTDRPSVPIPRGTSGVSSDPRRRPSAVGSPMQQYAQGLLIDPKSTVPVKPPVSRCASYTHNSAMNSPVTPSHPHQHLSPLVNVTMPQAFANANVTTSWSPQSPTLPYTSEVQQLQALSPSNASPSMAFVPSLSRNATSASFRGGGANTS